MDARRRLALFAAALISLLIAGCAGKSKDELLPQNGPTMKEVYDGHFNKTRQHDDPSQEVGSRRAGIDPGLTGYTRDAANEVENLFPRLPNPDLVMYVYPHLTGEGYPVPGYSTTFPLYERVEYALPGEAEGWR